MRNAQCVPATGQRIELMRVDLAWHDIDDDVDVDHEPDIFERDWAETLPGAGAMLALTPRGASAPSERKKA